MKQRAHPRRSGRAPGYRPCVGVVLLNPEGLVFVGRRRSDAGTSLDGEGAYAWQMPQGGIDPGESPIEAARRELYEETSVRSVTLLAEAPDWYTYEFPPIVAGRAWRGRYRGQTQKWFAFRFDGAESEIDVEYPGGGSHRPEFSAWRWVRMDELSGLIIPFKRPVYEKVVEAFASLTPRSD